MYFVTKVPILTDKKNLEILYMYTEYILKILTHWNYKKLSKRKILTCKYAAKCMLEAVVTLYYINMTNTKQKGSSSTQTSEIQSLKVLRRCELKVKQIK